MIFCSLGAVPYFIIVFRNLKYIKHFLQTPVEMTDLCRKLTVEFLHYVIEARALRENFQHVPSIPKNCDIVFRKHLFKGIAFALYHFVSMSAFLTLKL
jgi:hypothetical protein